MSPEVGDNRETLAYFCFMLQALSFQLVAPRVTCLRCRGGGVSLCDNDAKSRCRQVNKSSCPHQLFTSDIWSYATTISAWSPLGFRRRQKELQVFIFYLLLAMSPEVGDSREILAYFCFSCKPFPFSLWRCGRLVFFRLLFADANSCLCRISDFENEFSVAICQIQQSTIATASLGLLKPAAVVRKRLLLEKFSAFRFPFSVGLAPAEVVRNGNRYYIL